MGQIGDFRVDTSCRDDSKVERAGLFRMPYTCRVKDDLYFEGQAPLERAVHAIGNIHLRWNANEEKSRIQLDERRNVFASTDALHFMFHYL